MNNLFYSLEDGKYYTYPDGDEATGIQIREVIEANERSISKLQQENEKLKDNWNYIKKMFKEARQEKYISGYCGTCTDVDIDFLLGKMQELEKGSRE